MIILSNKPDFWACLFIRFIDSLKFASPYVTKIFIISFQIKILNRNLLCQMHAQRHSHTLRSQLLHKIQLLTAIQS